MIIKSIKGERTFAAIKRFVQNNFRVFAKRKFSSEAKMHSSDIVELSIKRHGKKVTMMLTQEVKENVKTAECKRGLPTCLDRFIIEEANERFTATTRDNKRIKDKGEREKQHNKESSNFSKVMHNLSSSKQEAGNKKMMNNSLHAIGAKVQAS